MKKTNKQKIIEEIAYLESIKSYGLKRNMLEIDKLLGNNKLEDLSEEIQQEIVNKIHDKTCPFCKDAVFETKKAFVSHLFSDIKKEEVFMKRHEERIKLLDKILNGKRYRGYKKYYKKDNPYTE